MLPNFDFMNALPYITAAAVDTTTAARPIVTSDERQAAHRRRRRNRGPVVGHVRGPQRELDVRGARERRGDVQGTCAPRRRRRPHVHAHRPDQRRPRGLLRGHADPELHRRRSSSRSRRQPRSTCSPTRSRCPSTEPCESRPGPRSLSRHAREMAARPDIGGVLRNRRLRVHLRLCRGGALAVAVEQAGAHSWRRRRRLRARARRLCAGSSRDGRGRVARYLRTGRQERARRAGDRRRERCAAALVQRDPHHRRHAALRPRLHRLSEADHAEHRRARGAQRRVRTRVRDGLVHAEEPRAAAHRQVRERDAAATSSTTRRSLPRTCSSRSASTTSGVRTFAGMCHWYFTFKTGLQQGFDVWDTSAMPPDMTDNDRRVHERPPHRRRALPAREARERGGPTRFFAWFHYFDPHLPYVPHAGAPDLAAADGSSAKARAPYDDEVWFTDQHIGRLLDYVASQPWGADTAIVLTADHGEAFGEHNHSAHGSELWESLVRVPLIVYVPGAWPEARRGEAVAHRSRADAHRAARRAAALGPVAPRHEPRRRPGRAPRPVRSTSATSTSTCRWARSTRCGARSSPDGSPGMKLIDVGGRRYELYDLSRDPEERANLAPTRR